MENSRLIFFCFTLLFSFSVALIHRARFLVVLLS